MPLFSSKSATQNTSSPPPAEAEKDTAPKRRSTLFGRKKDTDGEAAPAPEKQRTGTGLFGRKKSADSVNSNASGVRKDPSVAAARQKLQDAEAAEKEADRALAQARAAVKEAHQHVKVVEQEAKEEARKAKIKEREAKSLGKSAKGLGRHG